MVYFLSGVGAGILITVGFWGWRVGQHKRHKPIPSLTKFVVFSFGVVITYSIAEMIVSTITGITHDTLTTCVYACFGGEILSCALIKIFKLQNDDSPRIGE